MTSFLPGATLGIIGGGQLARMMVLEARRMGYRTCILSPERDDPAVVLSDDWVAGRLDDLGAAERLAKKVDVVTLDTEHVPASILSAIEASCPVRPSSSILRTVQDRRRQREFLQSIDAPQPRCRPVSSLQELRDSVDALGVPCVLKTRRAGYDGKGQALIRTLDQLDSAWTEIGAQPAMLEEFIEFDFEISVLLARNPKGEIRFYPVARNAHRNHVLHTTIAPADIDRSVESEAFDIAARIVDALDHIGMMAVEMFVVNGSRLLVNELAPRPHNSGHYTFGGCRTSQFEQHIRAVFDLTLGDPSLSGAAVMVNLLGDLWRNGEPDWAQVLSLPEAHLHLYGKRHAPPGRKMGHVLILAEDREAALRVSEEMLVRLEAKSAKSSPSKREVTHPG